MAKWWVKELIVFIALCTLSVCLYQAATKWELKTTFNQLKLSEMSQSLLTHFNAPLLVHLYSQDVAVHQQVQTLITRYQLLQPHIQFDWQRYPLHHTAHTLVIEYGKNKQILDLDHINFNEYHLTQALFKLHRKANQWVVFLQGHNEPDPFGSSNRDFSLFRVGLENQGLTIQRLNLIATPFIADNIELLIVASPQSALLPKEEDLLFDYVSSGKDLLWLIDPNSYSLPKLQALLGVTPLPGTIIDLHGQKLGTPHPAITIVEQYPALPFQPPKALCAFPWAVALQSQKSAWQTQPILWSDELSWTETGSLNQNIAFEPEKQEKMGPLILGLILTRQITPTHEQRIIVIGNSRFLSNGAIENYGNLAFGINLTTWLCHDDVLVDIIQPVAEDKLLQIHFFTAFAIEYMCPLLPFLMLSVFIFYRHKQLR